MMSASFLRATVAALAITALAACDSAEERAEGHYQSGLALLESGDVKRALVEFRNVFALDGSHKEARLAYAEASRSVGNLAQSYTNYLRIVEEFPEEHDARLQLVEMAIITQNWDEAQRHAAELAGVEGEVEGKDVAILALEFRQAVLDRDLEKMGEITSRAEFLDAKDPENPILQRILIEGYQSTNAPDKALAVVDRAIKLDPNDVIMYQVRAAILQRKGDFVGLEQHLRDMTEQFPDDVETKGALIRLLVSTSQVDKAEAILRGEIETSEKPLDAHIALISFLRELNGDDAALVEIENAIPAYEDSRLLRALQAGINFDRGDNDGAIATMQTVVEESPPGEEGDRLKVTLARMLVAAGNDVGARGLVEEVLAHDPSQVTALKMSAEWLIEGDKADDAINLLRQALDQEPEDADAMTLMAMAHQRNGNAQLSQDLLALAVEASGNAPGETLRFARVLIGQGNARSAESSLVTSLRSNPGNVQLLTTLGQVYFETQDWPRLEQVEVALRKADTEQARSIADGLRLDRISAQRGAEEASAYLQSLVEQDDENTEARIALIQSTLSEGKSNEALEMAQKLAAELPDAFAPMMVLGNTQLATGDTATAEATFRAVVEKTGDPRAVLQLVRLVNAEGREEEALPLIDAALEKTPDAGQLLWAKASILEAENDIDGAISIYEQLYAADSNSLVVANNLSSLIATYKDDEASLDRAFVVSRRLRGSDVPAFQDTYGWIQFRKGNLREAITYLEPAAEGLKDDPIVQYHLGKAYLENEQPEQALKQFQAVAEIAGDSDTRKQIVEALEQVKLLSEALKQ